ncbi:hypothetical protein GPECTOR_3g428 [Gonium pectorale]|uniref:Cationic amino acid transporter C-terminal domain-containing protein n=1 Tax=Gonium pectorale TaxID=33097 RepID=A0A150GZY9_GONPE|nr:hypothetical protein GPECTOR_3g428 [Gonium pectorale]|eukprot:KXZ55292.1 hypothetical protein GPECTOR_3g428 [Gonium pectorale]
MFTAGFLALFIDIELLAELVSIGTLVVFCSVCAGVLFRRYHVHGSGQPMRPVLSRLGGVVLAAIGFSVSFTEHAPLYVPAIFLVIWLGITCSFLMLPVVYIPQVFRCPASPFLPSLGMLATLHLIGSLGWPAYVRWIVWFTLGTVVYLSYGMHKSQAGEGLGPRTPDGRTCRAGSLEQTLMGPAGSPTTTASTDVSAHGAPPGDVLPSLAGPPTHRHNGSFSGGPGVHASEVELAETGRAGRLSTGEQACEGGHCPPGGDRAGLLAPGSQRSDGLGHGSGPGRGGGRGNGGRF